MGETSVTRDDGRLTRAARTRTAVVDALLTLNERGELRPTARDIAAEAGVSLRSVYVHFDDLEALFLAASQRHAEQLGAADLPPLLVEGELVERLDAFVARRTAIHEFSPGVRRAALLQAPFSPTVRKSVHQGRMVLRAEVGSAFAPELAAVEGDELPLLRALDTAASSVTWESLRGFGRLPVEQATSQMRAMLVAFVRHWVPDAAGLEAAASSDTESSAIEPTAASE